MSPFNCCTVLGKDNVYLGQSSLKGFSIAIMDPDESKKHTEQSSRDKISIFYLYLQTSYLRCRTFFEVYLFQYQDSPYSLISLPTILTMLEATLSLDWCISAAWNTAVILMFSAVLDAQSWVISLTAIPLVSFGTVMSVSLGHNAAHGVGLQVVCWRLADNSIVVFALFVERK